MKKIKTLKKLILAISIVLTIPVFFTSASHTCLANPIVSETTAEEGVIDTIVNFIIDVVKDKQEKIEEQLK